MIVAVSNARRWGIVSLLFTASLINYLDRATLAVALPAIARDLAFGPALKGILLSSFFWSYAAMQIPIGWFADRLNLRWLYAGLFALWSLACGLTGFAGSLTVLVALRMLVGVGESIYLAGEPKSLLHFSRQQNVACFRGSSTLAAAQGGSVAKNWVLRIRYSGLRV